VRYLWNERAKERKGEGLVVYRDYSRIIRHVAIFGQLDHDGCGFGV